KSRLCRGPGSRRLITYGSDGVVGPEYLGVTKQTEVVLGEAFAALLPHLDERQRRLALGAAAWVLGYGGVRRVARVARVAESTVARGARELGGEPADRVRAVGAGRKRLRERDPGLVPALLALVEPDQRGDPESPLRWTVQVHPEAGRRADPAGAPGGRGHGGRAAPRPRGSPCRAPRGPPRGPATRTATRSFGTSTARSRSSPRPGSRGSAWARRRRKCSASTRRPGRSGIGRGSRYGCAPTTSPRRAPRRQCPTASTTWPPTAGGCRWAAMGTPPRSRSRPCAAGGTVRAGTATRRRPGCGSPPRRGARRAR